MANLVSIPIYKINSSNTLKSPIPTYMGFPGVGLFVEPVGDPNNDVNGALIYSKIKSSATGGTEFYSTMTVAAIISAANL